MDTNITAEVSALQGYGNTLINMIIAYAPKVILALLVLVIGLAIINKLSNVVQALATKRNVDPTLRTFISDLIRWGLKALLFVSVASMIGIQTTSFVAILGAAGLAVGLALQGTLANFAGGALLLLFKPFKVGDLIKAQGYTGVVQEIQIFVTKITTPENHEVVIPNGPLSNGSLVNLSAKPYVRVDHTIGVSYTTDLSHAKAILLEVLNQTEHVLNDPAPFVGVSALADSSVNLVVRSFTPPEFYWNVYFESLEKSKIALDQAGIEIPFPQRVVHSPHQQQQED